MLIPYTVDVPMERWPFANWALIVVTSIVSLIIMVGQIANHRSFRPQEPAPRAKRANPAREAQMAELRKRGYENQEQIQRIVDAQDFHEADEDAAATDPFDDLIPPGALRPRNFRFLQLFSCLFVHGGLFHLIGNMIFLFVFGNAVNAKLGHIQFLVAYFLCGAVASAAWLMFGNGIPCVGASGAIMGIVGIFLILYPRNDVTVLYAYTMACSGSFEISSMWLIMFYMLGDLFGTLVWGGAGGVAYVAHLGGAGVGIAMGATAIALGFYRPTRYEQNLLQLFGWQPKKRKKKKKKKEHAEVSD